MSARFESVAILMLSESRYWLMDVARELKRRYGSTIHCYCGGPQEVEHYRREASDLFASITDRDILVTGAMKPIEDRAALLKRAGEWEARIGKTINQLSVTQRHLGRGYAPGGFNHPRSRYSESIDADNVANAYVGALDFWEAQIRQRGITLIINPTREAAIVGRILGVPVRKHAGSRYKSYHYWGHNEYFENPAFEETFDAVEDGPEPDLVAPYTHYELNRKRFLRNQGLRYAVTQFGLTVARYIYWHLRGYQKAKGYFLGDSLGYIYRRWRDFRWLSKHATARLADLEGKSFAFLPLATEPEVSLQQLSPEYTFQLSAIISASRDLPAGTTLVVKEALAAVGRRPSEFYRQIGELKNVVMADTAELGNQIVSKANVVITISGTAGFEAAGMGIPVISFGLHNIYNFLSHVAVVRDQTSLAGHLRKAFTRSDQDIETAKRDGRRFIEAVVRNSFDMGNYDYHKLKSYEQSTVTDGIELLVGSLRAVSHSEGRGQSESKSPVALVASGS